MKNKLVILHGWSLDRDFFAKWSPLKKILEKESLKVSLLKIPGLDYPVKKVWGLNDYVKWLDKNIGKANNINLLGHSFGGQIAIRYSSKFPDKIKKLVLIGSSGIRDKSISKIVKRVFYYFIAKIGKFCFGSNDKLRNLLYLFVRERDYLLAPPLLRKIMSNMLKEEILADLRKIESPTLIIWGKKDIVTPFKNTRIIHKSIKNSKIAVVENARHSPQFTHPKEVAKSISDFLKR